MASRPPRTTAGAYAPNTASRTNEYFVPRDGIDREVITADICRYLGNDALVRPGTYSNAETNQVTQGYYITAYRNLTSAMITDLKNDSARWEAERRRQSGAGAVAVRYQDSHIRDGPQRALGGGNGGPGGPPYGAPSREYDNGPRYGEADGSAGAYNTASGPYGNAGVGGGAGVGYTGGGSGGGGGGGGYAQPPPPASFPAPMHTGMSDSRYGVPPSGPAAGHGGYDNVGNTGGGGMGAPEGYAVGSYYQASASRDAYPQDMAMDDAPAAPLRRTSPNTGGGYGGSPGNNFRGPFPNVPSGGGGGYGGFQPLPNGPGAAYAQPVDNNYGRAPNMPAQGFSSVHDMPIQPQQYEEPPAFPPSPSRTGPAAPSTKTQLPAPSGPSAGQRRDRPGNDRPEYRDRDRMTDRDHRDATPPNKQGIPNKPVIGSGGLPPHHHYGRR